MTTNNRLKELRNKKKIKGPEIARILNITPQYYYELEKGEKRLNETLLRKLSEFYKVPTDYILGIDSNKTKETVISGLHRPGGYVDEDIPDEIREEIERYAEYLIEKYKKGEYKPPKGK